MEPRTADGDVDAAGDVRRAGDIDEALVELEETQQIDVVALEEAQATQVGEFVGLEAQAAELPDLGADLLDVRGEVDAAAAASEPVLDLAPGN